jgi:uncharacterized integral membrane protein
MQAIRTLLLLLLTIVIVAFIAINWQSVPVNFWPLRDGQYLYLEWPVGFIVLLSFAAGLLPMWLIARTTKWRLNRRIANLENSVRATSTVAPATPVVADPVVVDETDLLAPTTRQDPLP